MARSLPSSRRSRYGAAAGAIDAVAAGALPVGLEDALGENAAEGGDDGGLREGEGAQLPGEGEDVLADGDVGEHAVDEAGGGVLHPASGAAGAGGAGAASIGDQDVVAALSGHERGSVVWPDSVTATPYKQAHRPNR